MNTYAKYCPNVFVAKCDEKHEKGEIIEVTTKYGKENECEVHNLVHEKDGFFYYSITRVDGYDAKERYRRKAERYGTYSQNAEARADAYFERSQDAVKGIEFGQPILVGHHSEKMHRAAIEKSNSAMSHSVAEWDKSKEYAEKADTYQRLADSVMNLSMPESLEYYAEALEKAKEYHEGLKSGKYPREHSYSVVYAKKKVNELEKNLAIAKKLWE